MTADEINKLAEAVNRWICANGRAYRHLDDMGEVVNPIVYTTFHDARLGDDYVEFVPVKFEELVALREQLRAALAASPSAPAASSEDARDAALPSLPERDTSSERQRLWRLVNDWHDAEPGPDAAKAADRFEDEVDALLTAYARAAIAATPEAPK